MQSRCDEAKPRTGSKCQDLKSIRILYDFSLGNEGADSCFVSRVLVANLRKIIFCSSCGLVFRGRKDSKMVGETKMWKFNWR